MKYKFIDSDGAEYEVNGVLTPKIQAGSLSRSSESYSFEQKIIERSFLPGAAKVGEARLESRGFSFTLEFAAETDALFDAYLNELLLWVEKTVTIVETDNSKMTSVTVQNLNVTYDSGSIKRSGDMTIDFLMLDGFWTDTTPIESNHSLSIGVNNIPVTNSGFLPVYPLLTFDVPAAAPQLDIYIDETKEGLQLVDDTLGTLALNELIIDCVNGSLTIEEFDRSQSITNRTGYFPIPVGDYTLVIDTPVACDLALSFFRRYYS